MGFNVKPLRERVCVLTESDWDRIEDVARSMYMSNGTIDMFQAEAYAMLVEIERIERGEKRAIN